MPQSLTSIERANPPPRRKSCLACTKAHRRCDQTSPACRRCSQRNVNCQYPQGPRFSRELVPVSSPASASATPHMPNVEQQIELLFDIGSTPQVPLDVLDFTLESSESFLGNLAPVSLERDTAASLLDSSRALVNQMPLTTTHEAVDRSQFVTDYQVRRVIAYKFQHTIDKISASPFQMVLESQMPWCHPHLYDRAMPQSMQDAISSAALCAAKNDTNALMIRNCVESRVQDLLSSPASNTPLDIIARAHALFIYQILRMLDTDTRVYVNYHATMPLLEEAVYALIPHITFDKSVAPGQIGPIPDSLPLYPISATRDFWESWIFQESARRTVSIVSFFLLVYYFMRGELGSRCHDNTYTCRSVTLSGHLWRARDPVDFALAWRNERHFVVHSDALETATIMLDDAKSDDIDEFGKIFLTVMMGIDAAKGWLAVRGIKL